uniref:Src like adaptor 2 n=1 Tax=Aquila chrysaetos chrysaetos TaxID=223781 RepID=A0A663E0X7_AQUCH
VCRVLPSQLGLGGARRALSPLTFPTDRSGFLALALCDFPASTGAPTVLRMGEQLRVLSEAGQALGHAACPCTARRGSASAPCLYRWLYEGISRQKAEELLLQPGNRSGSFLIRESQTRQGCYSLSVRCSERASWDSVTHYRIYRLENGWLYISPRLTFPSLHDLVDHYSEFGEGLCCLLREPCFTEGARVAPVSTMPTVMNSLLLSEATSAPEEDSPISLGLREAISSYLLLTEMATPKQSPAGKGQLQTLMLSPTPLLIGTSTAAARRNQPLTAPQVADF